MKFTLTKISQIGPPSPMTSFQNFLRVFVSFILWSCFAAAAQAQNPVGTWDLLETKDGAAVDKIVVSRDGTISYSEFPGSWSQSGSSMTATLYGNQSLRNAGKALGDLKLEVNGDLISGTLYVIPQRQTFNVFARRHGVSAAQAERPATAERENRDAERRREAEHERAARASAERVALAKATESRQALPVYQSPVVTIPARPQSPPSDTRPSVPSPSANSGAPKQQSKAYLCPSQQFFDTLLHRKSLKPVTDMRSLMANDDIDLTVEQACADAEKQAAEFTATVGTAASHTYSKSVVKSVGACRLMNDGIRVGLNVNLETPSVIPCNAPTTTISK